MFCPRCLVVFRKLCIDGVTVDVCPDCRGVWLDPGELEWLTRDPALLNRSEGNRTAAAPEPPEVFGVEEEFFRGLFESFGRDN